MKYLSRAHSAYPFAPLRPIAAASRLHVEATNYGIGLGVERGVPSEDTDRRAERVVALASRVHRDALQLENGPLPAVAR